LSNVEQARRFPKKRSRLLSVCVSVGLHSLALWGALSMRVQPPTAHEPPPIVVSIIPLPPPPPIPPTPPQPPSANPTPEPAPADPPKRRDVARETPKPPPPEVPVIAAGKAPKPQPGVDLSESDIAGATTSASGAGGGTCNMAQWLEGQLRKDRHVQAALARNPTGKPILVWNGAWVRHPGEEGEGLAAVREILMWEIAFAPEACRAKPVRGLMILSVNDGPGGARVAFGRGQWTWADMLGARRGPPPSTFD
jgi:hypothetical protein